MPKNLADLKKYLTRVKIWAAVAAALTVGLLAYYGVEGLRYWQASNQAQALTAQRVVLSKTLQEALRGQAVLAAQLDEERNQMEQLEQLFHHPQADELIGIVAQTARENQVTLSSIGAGEDNPVIRGNVEYQNQPMTIILEGQNQDVYRFFSALHQRLPMVNLATVRMSGGGAAPAQVHVQLGFLLSPQVVLEEEDSKGKSSSTKSSKPSGASENAGSKTTETPETIGEQDAK